MYGKNYFGGVLAQQIKADFERAFARLLSFAGVATRVPLSRQHRPRALWQWKNGKTAPLYERDFPIEGAFKAWDRSLGMFVVYADR